MSMGVFAFADEETPAPSYPYPPTDDTDQGNYILSDDGKNYNPTTDADGNYVRGDEVTFSITIPKTAADKANETDHTYAAYQIFKGDLYVNTENGVQTKTLSNIEWGDGISEAGIAALYNKYGLTDADKTAAKVAEKLNRLAFDDDAAKDFAAFFNTTSYLKSGNPSTVSGDDYVMDGLHAGYYLVKDTNDNGEFAQENYAQTRYMLEVVGNVTAKPKQSIPTLVKKVDDKADSSTSEDAVTWHDTADYDIGDKVPYQITVTLPENIADYTTYEMTITDEMDSGLTYNNDAVVYFNYPGVDKWIVVNDHANVTVSNSGQVLTVNISNVKEVLGGFRAPRDPSETAFSDLGRQSPPGNFVTSVDAKTEIIVRYSATLNENAAIGPTGNKNEAQLEYSNNPNGTGTGKTPKDTNIVFTYEVDVNKVERDDAVEPISADIYNSYTDEQKVGWVKDSSGKYYKTKALVGADFTLYKKVADSKTTGAQTGSAIYAALPDQIRPLAKDVFDNNDNYYVEVGNKTGTTADSVFTFEGVDDGEYVLVESTVPAGYNGIKAKSVTVTATHTQDPDELKLDSLTVNNTDFTATTTSSTVDETTVTTPTGLIKTEIENNSGTVLPSTGGIGTTIFYVVGSILVVAAGVLLITKKRMSREG